MVLLLCHAVVDASAQTRAISYAGCQSLRQRLGDHARLYDITKK